MHTGELVGDHVLDSGDVLHSIDEVVLRGGEVEYADQLHDAACAGRSFGQRLDHGHAVGEEHERRLAQSEPQVAAAATMANSSFPGMESRSMESS